MLTQLSVRNHTLVESLDIEFDSGLSAITGETGAGKSILLNALGLTLGDRADFDQVRNGAQRAEIHAIFDITELPSAQRFLKAQSLDDNDECLLRRVINANGSSKAWINSQPVTLSVLRELAEQLISIHSQHEHQSLLQADYQQALLDSYAGCSSLANQVADAYGDWNQARTEIAELESNMEQHRQRQELLKFQLDELSLLDLAVGEFESLEQEQKQLANAESIQKTLHNASQILSEDENFSLINGLRQVIGLTQSVDIGNENLIETNSLLSDSYAQLEEARDSLRRTADSVQMNPQRLTEIDTRLSAAFDLSRKHRCEPSQLPAIRDEQQAELDQIGDLNAGLDALKQKVDVLDANYQSLAKQLSASRKAGATKLSHDVQSHFDDLNMKGADLQIDLKPINASARGLEQCELQIRTNPGQTHKPLARSASGGELSRVSLAIQVVTAGTSQSPTLVFDEVDVGIGGATATVVGQKLHTLGNHAQVICVTHLAQVASHANNHLSVLKISEDGQTHTQIKPVEQQDRKEEIARMLSGDTDSEHSLKHAEELLSSALG